MTQQELKQCEADYIRFMGIDRMPQYSLRMKSVTLSHADGYGYDSLAQSHYIPATQDHILTFADNIVIKPYVVFHEFTHMVDTETYAAGNKVKYACLSGYTEYHASQVELLKLLNVNTLMGEHRFSVDQAIETITGITTVQQYVQLKADTATEIFERSDFPKDIEQMKSAIGVLFNYWGLRSICRMYASDYSEKENPGVFTKFIDAAVFNTMNTFMTGWLNDFTVDLSMKGYANVIMPIIQKYNLA